MDGFLTMDFEHLKGFSLGKLTRVERLKGLLSPVLGKAESRGSSKRGKVDGPPESGRSFDGKLAVLQKG